ncbi:MAG: endonuclease/exonuclease/phosphatase family protein [Gordonia paraffinivorans]
MTRRLPGPTDAVLAVSLVAATAATGLRRYRGVAQMPVAAASFASWIVLAAPLTVVAACVGRRPRVAAAAGAVTALAAWDRRRLVPSRPRGGPGAASMTVMQANLWLGRADAAAIVDTVRTHAVNLLCVQEITVDCRDALTRAGIGDLMPHRVVVAAPEGAGTGLWSRHPLSEPRKLSGFTLAAVAARMELPSGGSVTVLSVHPMPPYPYAPELWLGELQRIRDAVDEVHGPVIVGGDLNATHDHAAFRDLLGDDLADAGASSRSGPLPTYPAHKRWIPPLIGIDHVLLRGVRAERVRTVVLPGSDHRGLLAAVHLE